jgi:hypothetical protein
MDSIASRRLHNGGRSRAGIYSAVDRRKSRGPFRSATRIDTDKSRYDGRKSTAK